MEMNIHKKNLNIKLKLKLNNRIKIQLNNKLLEKNHLHIRIKKNINDKFNN
jgi:hypothetical protein